MIGGGGGGGGRGGQTLGILTFVDEKAFLCVSASNTRESREGSTRPSLFNHVIVDLQCTIITECSSSMSVVVL